MDAEKILADAKEARIPDEAYDFTHCPGCGLIARRDDIDDDGHCPQCRPAEPKKEDVCARCGQTFPADELFPQGKDKVCEGCLDEPEPAPAPVSHVRAEAQRGALDGRRLLLRAGTGSGPG